MEIIKFLAEFKIPDIVFFVVEYLILQYVYLEYRIQVRKRGRPKKSTAHKLMEKVSKKFHHREKLRR